VKAILHDDEIPISTEFVRRLVNAAFSQYANAPLARLNQSGSSNVLFRLGKDLLVRLPRQPGGSRLIDKERRWLGEIAPNFPVIVPEIIALGEPMFGYSERWSIVRWIDGDLPKTNCAGSASSSGRLSLAIEFADLIE